jgi:hypothetical protein
MRVMKGNFIINSQEEGKEIFLELSSDVDIKEIVNKFNSFLKQLGYQLPGYVDFVYYDDLK